MSDSRRVFLVFRRAPEREKRTRFEMLKGIDADYYGYRDDDDGVLEELERAAEEGSLQQVREGVVGQGRVGVLHLHSSTHVWR